MSAPLFDRIDYLRKQKAYPFHMPGHKFNSDFYIDGLFSYDYTEIEGTDNLFAPEGVICDAQNKAKKLFGADNSFFMVNGSSGGLLAAILSVCETSDKIIVARNCHKSVYNGLVLSGAEPVYVYPEITKYGVPGGISPEDIYGILENRRWDDRLKAVVITSPTYEGFCSDIGCISDIVHSFGKILIVDEAHGSHFIFNKAFPDTALSMGADIVIQSWHKTLPALGQCAALHTKGKRINLNRLKQMLQTVQTSSPSYILMSVMDKCRELLEERGEALFSPYVEMLKGLRGELAAQNTIKLAGEDLINKYWIKDIDISKLFFYINSDMNGKALENELSREYNLIMEYSGVKTLLAMTSVADTKRGFELIKRGIIETSKKVRFEESCGQSGCYVAKTSVAISPREAVYRETEKVRLEDSTGRICGEWVVPYPPGIPLIISGELITEEVIKTIQLLVEANVQLTGVSDGNMEYITCLKL